MNTDLKDVINIISVLIVILMTSSFVFSETIGGKEIFYILDAISFGFLQYILDDWLKD